MDNSTTQILSPDWIAPVVPERTLLKGHSLIIKAERIVDLLPTDEARLKYPEAVETALPGRLLTPGFVNVHGHAAMTLLRGIADDREMMDWLTNWIWPIEGKLVNK